MTDSSSGDSLVAILDELAELVESARSMPMSATALVNRAEVLALIDSAKAVLPGQLSEADVVISDADAVAERARREAGKILEKAQARAQRLVAQEAVVTTAKQQADQIVADARAEASRIAKEADEYCDRQLARFEVDLSAISTQVAAGRARLVERARGRSEPGDDAPEPPRTSRRAGRIDRVRKNEEA
ncbi:MAG: hypothetical protein ACK5H2_05115 [Beutenbergiaceae bacterium]